ncbi:MAG: transglutaminase domain-containing protein, partial [Saprospiraceae bacterium]|nr:transglutaminase domain-containing protein [Saprospiraceae bacterium]
KYEVEYNGLFHYPSFRPVPGYEVSVDHSQFKVSAPLDLGIRFKANYLDSLPSVEKDDNQINYTWNFDHLELIKEEILSPPEEEILPIVYLAANQFEYDGYAGSMDSWNTFGQWLYDLLPHESFLSTQEKQTIHTIAASNNSTEDKIRALYEYLQSKTRYVSVQLGIGGYQPMAADKVSELGYGDCKALSNYMRVILEEAGIPSFYTIIGGGRNHSSFTFTDFPNGFQANHVILSVPLSTDTVFLECTSQKNPYGYLGSFTGNRNALMVSEQGGQLIKTTSYDLDDYLIKRREHLILNPDGSLEGNAKTLYHGVAFENVEGKQDESKEDARMEFLKKIDVPGFNLKSINYQYTQAPVPEMTEEVFFNIDQYAQSSNDRVFFKPNLFSRWTFQLPKDDHRTQPVVINQPIYQVDSLVIDLPNEYMSEALIEPVDLHSDFGVFKVETILKDNQLHLVRQLEIYRNRYAQDSYQDLRDFFKKIWKADKASVVLIKKKT